ncbi:hypothetical protein DPMN_150212 [Dreissena polymorpha]|uniref:IPT/TIG domain-containing protein n=1 Tax=Dreissena polymorpha TaxID=45954 RepID=A0A9D4FD10_DREPO|nr:hypothetical protein DPMN_150212 [Dreissena polymorpha]
MLWLKRLNSPFTGTAALGTALTITGTGFRPTAGENKVTIAVVVCTLTAVSVTSITCSVGHGPVGAHPGIVNVAGKGMATGPVAFTYTEDITRITPTTGSLGGRTSSYYFTYMSI